MSTPEAQFQRGQPEGPGAPQPLPYGVAQHLNQLVASRTQAPEAAPPEPQPPSLPAEQAPGGSVGAVPPGPPNHEVPPAQPQTELDKLILRPSDRPNQPVAVQRGIDQETLGDWLPALHDAAQNPENPPQLIDIYRAIVLGQF